MKKYYLFAQLIAVVLLSVYFQTLNAATIVDNSSMKIAVIDYRQVMQQSKQAKEVIDKLKKQFQPRETKIRAAQATLNQKEIKLKRDAAILTTVDRRTLENQIISERRDLDRLQEDYRQDLSLAQEQLLQGLMEQISKVVREIADSEKYDLIFEKSRIPYVSARLDITEQVLKALE